MAADDATRARAATSLAALERWFASCPSCVVAFSGGVDSALVAVLARRLLGREHVLAAIAVSPGLKRRDLAHARALAATHDLALCEVPTDELSDPHYQANGGDRCYWCKAHYCGRFDALRREEAYAWLLGGENRDDHADHRPGLRAMAEAGVRAPLAECGLGKAEVRAVAERLGLACWNRPASPCLASRIPYHTPITAARLRQVEAAEDALAALGFTASRVRHHGDLARLEVPPADLPRLRRAENAAVAAVTACGFARVEIDPEGLISGKLNRALS
jgi:uncharacterized protein